MTKRKYFVIPFENVPESPPPPYTMWFASWSEKRPIVEPGQLPPLVVGVTKDDRLPPRATLLVELDTKDPPPPPPPLTGGSPDDYQKAFDLWLTSIKDA